MPHRINQAVLALALPRAEAMHEHDGNFKTPALGLPIATIASRRLMAFGQQSTSYEARWAARRWTFGTNELVKQHDGGLPLPRKGHAPRAPLSNLDGRLPTLHIAGGRDAARAVPSFLLGNGTADLGSSAIMRSTGSPLITGGH